MFIWFTLGGEVKLRNIALECPVGLSVEWLWDVCVHWLRFLFYFVSLFQGILLEHQEKEFGDKVDIASVLEAAKKIVVEK